MKLEDVKVGMLVKSERWPEISDKPGTVVGFSGCSFVAVASEDRWVRYVSVGYLEPVHDGCDLCKHAMKGHHSEPCRDCRGTRYYGDPLYTKLPDLWEPVNEGEPGIFVSYGLKRKELVVQISREDAELAASAVDFMACVAEKMGGIDSDGNPNVVAEWSELAERLRRGG